MKLLGVASKMAAFRWDLLYLFSQLETDERAGVATLASPIDVAMQTLETRQVAYDAAQKAVIVATALVAKRDKVRGRLILELGGVARATGRETYTQLFPKYSPSHTTRLGMALESDEMTRILGELGTLVATHPLRLKYEKPLSDAQADFAAALTQLDTAEVALKLERSQIQRCKVDLDKLRLETHGKLLALLADKAEADAFYRPTLRTADEAAVN